MFLEFLQWKNDIQSRTSTKWSITCSKKSADTTYYSCNRSGKQVLKHDGRDKEFKGVLSIKTNTLCAAHLVHSVREGKHHVTFCTDHTSHEIEEECLPVADSAKENIKQNLEQGVPPKEMLRKIREKTDPAFASVNFINRKDIENIIAKHSINQEYKLDEEDGQSVHKFVENNKESAILYKPMGQVLSTKINENDFLLAIMNDHQRAILKKAMMEPPGVICIDATHGTNAYGIQLVTLMIVNSFGNGIPCAFFYTTKEDVDALGLFFSAIKTAVGNLAPKVFMSDDASAYWNAFKATMDCENAKRLLCTWHIDRNWRKKLCSTVPLSLRADVYQKLCLLRTELDEDKFEKMKKNFLNPDSRDKRTETFAQYFRSTYSDRSEC